MISINTYNISAARVTVMTFDTLPPYYLLPTV